MSHPVHRARHLSAMTRTQIDALPHKASAVVILPTGSVEQHGPHLPVGVDALLGQAWLAAALDRLPAEAQVYVAPPITYGKSNEHVGFPGTITVSARTLHRLLVTIARQLSDLGFRTLAVLNTHGGNSAVIVATLREIQATLGMNAGMVAPTWRPQADDDEMRFGIHAGRFETAWMLAVAPHLVRMEHAVCELPARVADAGDVQPVRAPATAAWMTSDISKSGVMGDATAANPDDGAAWFEAGAASLAARIIQLLEQVAPA